LATSILAILFACSFFPEYWPIKLLSDVFSMMVLWWFGVLLADVFTGRITGLNFDKLSFLIVAIPIALFKPVANILLVDSIWAVGFVGLLSSCFALQKRGFTLNMLNRLDWLGSFSYTLYAIHFPILVFLSGLLMQSSPDKTLPHHLFFVILALPLPTIIAYFVYFAVEKPFITVRK
jgi:peptidoglycan/LPS O-acetylase OafA/YrhL